jgi:hypothetical protein
MLCHKLAQYAECHYVECQYAEFRGTQQLHHFCFKIKDLELKHSVKFAVFNYHFTNTLFSL